MARKQPDDPKRPNGITKITDFAGLAPSADPHDIHPGLAAIQVNAVPIHQGELRVRRGFRVVQFED
jgi:hypothetical protein